MGGGGDTKEDVGVMGILSPSVGVDSHGCASPLILGGPTSPSGSGEGFLFLAVLATGCGGGKKREKINKWMCTEKAISFTDTKQDSLKNFYSLKACIENLTSFKRTCNSQHLRLMGP